MLRQATGMDIRSVLTLRYFLLAEQDRMIVKETQHFMAERMKAKVRTHPVDHTPSVTALGVVVDVILEALRDVSQDAK